MRLFNKKDKRYYNYFDNYTNKVKGTFLDNYITVDIRINCYAIDKFFVEVVYDGKQNVITEVRSFKTGQSLDKYSENFNKKKDVN